MIRILITSFAALLLWALFLSVQNSHAVSSSEKVTKSVYSTTKSPQRRFTYRLRRPRPKTSNNRYRGILRTNRARRVVSKATPTEKDITIANLQKEIRRLKLRIRILENTKLRKSRN